MSDVLNKMKSRRSIRKFKPDMVPQEILDQIIEAGLYAASGMGQQSPIIIQVTKKELRDEISKMNCEIGGWKEGLTHLWCTCHADCSCKEGTSNLCIRWKPCYGQPHACRT